MTGGETGVNGTSYGVPVRDRRRDRASMKSYRVLVRDRKRDRVSKTSCRIPERDMRSSNMTSYIISESK